MRASDRRTGAWQITRVRARDDTPAEVAPEKPIKPEVDAFETVIFLSDNEALAERGRVVLESPLRDHALQAQPAAQPHRAARRASSIAGDTAACICGNANDRDAVCSSSEAMDSSGHIGCRRSRPPPG